VARKYPQIALLFVVAACSDERTASAKPHVIALTDGAGEVSLALAIDPANAPERCAVSGATDLAVVRHEAVAIATTGTSTIMTLGPGRTGTEIIDVDGTTRMRVIEEPGRLDLVSKEGVPVAKIYTTSAQASVVDAARVQLLVVMPEGDHLIATASDGSTPETITGTTDLTLAAVLALPGVSPDVRALVACARVLPAPVSNVGTATP